MVCYLASVFHSWYSEASLYRWYRDILCFHCPLLLHHHALTLGFLRQAFMVCPWFLSIPLLDSGFSLYVAKRALSTLSCLRYISSVLFHFGVLPPYGYLLAPVTFSIAKLRQADYRKYRMVLFASQKDWQPSALYIKSGYSSLFPSNYLLVLFPCSLLDSTVKLKQYPFITFVFSHEHYKVLEAKHEE